MANFPTSLDNSTSLPNPTGTSTQNSPDHAGLHSAENAAIIAAETKLGTGATAPAANQLLVGTGAGTSAWQGLTSAQLLAILSDETGTGSAVFANTPTLITPKVDTINEATLNNGVTVAGVNLKAGFMSGANLTAGTVGSSQLAAGVVVQVVCTTYAAVATGTTIMPYDDTIPQNTEGDQYMTQAITPKSATNSLIIDVVFFGSTSVGNEMIIALFQDSTANALAANSVYNVTATGRDSIPLRYSMVAGTISATTFRLRAGSAVANTTTFGGDSTARRFGAVPKSSITIWEVKV